MKSILRRTWVPALFALLLFAGCGGGGSSSGSTNPSNTSAGAIGGGPDTGGTVNPAPGGSNNQPAQPGQTPGQTTQPGQTAPSGPSSPSGPSATVASMGPLRVDPSNPRYFTDGNGNVVYLTGSHTWSDLKDVGKYNGSYLDYNAWLDLLQSNGHNFMRGWQWELTMHSDGTYTPQPWLRTGPGTALDGKPKFDLSQFDQSYFDNIRARVIAAGQRGIYVSVMLFEGWGLQFEPASLRWAGHPFNSSNNINGINGDPNGTGQGLEIQTLQIPAVTAIQEAYVKKMIDTLDDLDNVLWEVANESGPYSTGWQYHMINFIKSYESTKPKQHPVGMTFQYDGGSDSTLFASPADWISPASSSYLSNPPAGDGSKVILIDTDHLGTPDKAWVWKSFTRGLNPIYMDGYVSPSSIDLTSRKNMGYSLQYAKKMDLAAMTPQENLSSTGYCLANPGSEYLVYQPSSGSSFTVSLAAGTYNYEWFNPATGAVAGTGTVTSGGGSDSFSAPFSGDAVLYLHVSR
ncbi:MAG: DUF6298 domain-containing protein [Nitrospiraceae bacterium]|nr:DUF6298 domain-containing protein [Nitrospiraceae bacterium]